MNGAKLADIAELLAHKGLAMTLSYAHLAPGQLHGVVSLLIQLTPELTPAIKARVKIRHNAM